MFGVWQVEATVEALTACGAWKHGEERLAFWLGYRASKRGRESANPFRDTGGDHCGVRFGERLINAWECGFAAEIEEQGGC